jgi:hypothetical protein
MQPREVQLQGSTSVFGLTNVVCYGRPTSARLVAPLQEANQLAPIKHGFEHANSGPKYDLCTMELHTIRNMLSGFPPLSVCHIVAEVQA